ncbi:MAG TPA: ABC transporter permease [Methylomusa anaerophila]|uniref:Putative aliphatic sulfonates transport permease protein SsuC n=1 Tax=Methylomusa anaerophila TaxID=1930071 RepID=A0A348AEM7_9FIRM|nr:ABC transporter permease [Methylomusa anaerophila]BBB89525.1 putative aliphatic sulfonates transport permease protein SsuC [Methylomusa anaerophila]HML90105.1 ABC transporter permease [Methylomusa anaerophila]
MNENAVSGLRKVYQSRVKLIEGVQNSNIFRAFARLSSGLEKIIAISLVLIIWEVIPRLELVDPFLLPPFSDVARSLYNLLSSGELFRHIGVSFQRSFAGFCLGAGAAIVLGIFMGWYSKLEEVVDPLVQACRNSSTLALYPVFLLFFGLGEASKIAIITWGAVWPALLNTIAGVKNTDPILIKSARSMGISQFALFYKVIVPAVLPYILTGIRLSATSSLLILVAAEMIGANSGLGFLVFYMEERYAVPEMYAGIITLSFIGVTVNYLLVELDKRLTGGWKEKIADDDD